MKLSVIMPVFNSGEELHRSIGSILKQSYKNWELILIDDGSKDNSLEICKKYSKEDSRIIIIEQENMGSGPARNNGLNKVTGDYVLFCDADDFYNTDAFEKFNKIIRINNDDLIISTYQEFKLSSDMEVYITNIKKTKEVRLHSFDKVKSMYFNLFKNNLISAPWAKLYKISIIKNNKIEFENIRRCQDIVFNIRYFSHIGSLSVIDEVTYNYQTPDAITYLSKFPKDMFEIAKIVDSYQKSKLIEWKEYNEEVEVYLNTQMFVILFICLRLNQQNNWKFTKKQKKEYYKLLLNDEKTTQVISNPVQGKFNMLIKRIVSTKNIYLIELFSRIVIIGQKRIPKIIHFLKERTTS